MDNRTAEQHRIDNLWGREATPEETRADLERDIRRIRPDWDDAEVADAVKQGGYHAYLQTHGKHE